MLFSIRKRFCVYIFMAKTSMASNQLNKSTKNKEYTTIATKLMKKKKKK